jgi:type II secretory pathway pseudopilin PulG
MFIKVLLKKYLKNSPGITLVEVIVTVSVITIFSGIIISDFPKAKRQFALSAATHKLAQDLRRAQDMSLSGTQLTDYGEELLLARGFGVYINLNSASGDNKRYIIYGDKNNDQEYDPLIDYNLDIVNIDSELGGVIIKGIYNVSADSVSINFYPPNPKTSISSLEPGASRIKIVLGLESNSTVAREVYVYTSGLIETK